MAGEGSVFRRCGCTDPVTGRQYGSRCPRLAAGGHHGSWYIRLELSAGLDGRRRRIRRGGYPSREAALEVLGRLRNPKSGETGAVVTVGDWLAHWLVSRTSPAASTVCGYAAHVRLYPTTVEVLRRYREEQERWYRAHGRIPSGYVFTALDGGPLSPDRPPRSAPELPGGSYCAPGPPPCSGATSSMSAAR